MKFLVVTPPSIYQTGMVIMYANCPIFWRSTLQTEIALSTAEAEYIALSTALRQVIPLMAMMEEIQSSISHTHFKAGLCLQIS